MDIAGIAIGRDRPPFVIAEIGVNHDGSLEKAMALVDAAVEARADAVKVQIFRAELLMSRAASLAAYQRDAGESDPIEMLRRLELPMEAMARIAARAREHGLVAIATVFSVGLVGEARAIGFDAFKTASPDIIHRPLLDALIATGLPLIVSTGASTEDEVRRALGWLDDARDRLALLQCVSAYPTAEADAAIAGMHALARLFSGPVGYSDHTTLEETGAIAIGAGACILEKHLTLDRSAPGPDHAASLDPVQFARYVAMAKRAHLMLGPDSKRVLEVERDVRAVSRQSIVAARAIRAGESIGERDVAFKRPGSGMGPYRLPDVIGKRAARDIEADAPVRDDDLA